MIKNVAHFVKSNNLINYISDSLEIRTTRGGKYLGVFTNRNIKAKEMLIVESPICYS